MHYKPTFIRQTACNSAWAPSQIKRFRVIRICNWINGISGRSVSSREASCFRAYRQEVCLKHKQKHFNNLQELLSYSHNNTPIWVFFYKNKGVEYVWSPLQLALFCFFHCVPQLLQYVLTSRGFCSYNLNGTNPVSEWAPLPADGITPQRLFFVFVCLCLVKFSRSRTYIDLHVQVMGELQFKTGNSGTCCQRSFPCRLTHCTWHPFKPHLLFGIVGKGF